jgi:hypothetical protein
MSSFTIFSFLHEFHTITENGQRILWGVRFCKCWLKNALSHKACATVLRPLKDLQCNSVSFTKECDQKHQFTRAW